MFARSFSLSRVVVAFFFVSNQPVLLRLALDIAPACCASRAASAECSESPACIRVRRGLRACVRLDCTKDRGNRYIRADARTYVFRSFSPSILLFLLLFILLFILLFVSLAPVLFARARAGLCSSFISLLPSLSPSLYFLAISLSQSRAFFTNFYLNLF